jgi:hypothetical protein
MGDLDRHPHLVQDIHHRVTRASRLDDGFNRLQTFKKLLDLDPYVANPPGSDRLPLLIHQRHVRVLTMMVNPDIIQPCTS